MERFSKAVKAAAFAALVAVAVHAENFKVGEIRELKLAEAESTATVSAGVNDALRIRLPDDMTYVCGIELNMRIPETIAAWRDSVAYSLYEDVARQKGSSELKGRRLSFATIPGRLSLNVYVPLTDEFNIKDNPYSERIPVMPKIIDNSVFFRFQLVMEDVPETFAGAMMDVTAKAVLIDKGTLSLTVEPAKQTDLPVLRSQGDGSKSEKKNAKAKPKDGKKFTVYIDDKPITSFRNVLLDTGEHHASIVSDSYRNELRTFVIDKARTTNLSVELRGIEPTLIFVCPVNTQIFFDEKQIENPKTAFIIEPGEHSVKMVVGDYEIVKTISAVNGRSYTMSLDIDASIYEEK